MSTSTEAGVEGVDSLRLGVESRVDAFMSDWRAFFVTGKSLKLCSSGSSRYLLRGLSISMAKSILSKGVCVVVLGEK